MMGLGMRIEGLMLLLLMRGACNRPLRKGHRTKGRRVG